VAVSTLGVSSLILGQFAYRDNYNRHLPRSSKTNVVFETNMVGIAAAEPKKMVMIKTGQGRNSILYDWYIL
jgi:hypothetical protein